MARVARGSRSGGRLQDRRRRSERVVVLVSVGDFWCARHLRTVFRRLVLPIVPFLASLCIARVGPAHANVTAYADTAALLGDGATECSAFGKTRELLRAEDLQDGRLDFETMSDVVVARRDSSARVVYLVVITGKLELLVQAETKTEVAFVANRQVWENEVAGRVRAVQVYHASNRRTGKDGGLVRVRHATRLSHVTGGFQRGKEKVVGVHHEGDVLGGVFSGDTGLDLQDLELNYGWRVDRSAIGGCLRWCQYGRRRW